MAEGGVPLKGGGFTVEKAWEHLLFQTRDKETTYEAVVADFIEPCRLQFVLNSELATLEFYRRIGQQQIFKILSSEHVGVEVDSSELADIDGFWSSLIKSVNRALESKTVLSLSFLSKNELETVLQNLDEYNQRLLTTGVVGVYYTYANTSCVAKFVGSDHDTRSLCEKIYEIMKMIFKHEHELEQRELKAMLDLGLFADLQEGFKDVMIQVDEEKSVVRFQGLEKGRIVDCLREFKVLIGRVQFIPLDFLPNSAQPLLRKKNSRKYIQEKVNVERIAFVTEGQHDYLVCRNQKNIADLKLSIQNCFIKMIIGRNCLHSSQWKDFFEKHGNEIIREDHGEKICLYFTSDLKEEVEKLLLSFGKPCSRVVRDFLQTYGTNLVKDLAEKHHVKAELQEDYVCFKGQYNDGKNAMNELERGLEISVLHFDYDEGCLLTSQKRQHLDAIGKRYRCSINAITFSQDPHTIWNKSDTGIEYLAKWKLHRNKGQISVTEIDFENAKLDGLISPVNECLFGEDIFGKANNERSYKEHCRSQGHKFELGQWEPLDFGKKYRGVVCVALVTSGTAIVDDKQIHRTIGSKLRESVTEIIHDSFSRGLWKIGFAVPNDNLDFRSKLDDILSGYQDVVDKFRGQNESELLVCVKQPAERWLQEVDYRLSWTVCTRRQVGPRYYGLFDKPHVYIEDTRKSLLEVKADCLVVAVSPKFDLSKGHVSKLLSEACGEKLQEELWSKRHHVKFPGEPLAVDAFNLSKEGVKKLVFGCLPVWKTNKGVDYLHILENFVQGSLLLADSHGCSSVAFPVLGTGKLEYPLQDAVVALMNGIDKYVAETTVGNISTVYIAVADDTTKKIFDLEQNRRKANSDMDVKQSEIEGHSYLFAEDENFTFYIANGTVFKALSSGRHMEVFFTPEAGKNVNVQKDLRVLGRIVIQCGINKDDLQSAFKEVIYMCEKERITSVAVYCCQKFSFSEMEQVDAILLAAQTTVYGFSLKDYPIRGKYYYLKHVTIVTSDAGYSVLSDLKLAEDRQPKTTSWSISSLKSSFFKSSARTELKWRSVCLEIPKTFINVILAGDKESDLKKAIQDIEKLVTSTDSRSDYAEFTDEVTAELNPGIVKYLKNLPEPELNSLKTEYYLENEFPSFPTVVNKKIEEEKPEYDDNQQVQFTIPVQNKDHNQELVYQEAENINFELKHDSFLFKKTKLRFKNLEVVVSHKDITASTADCIVSPVNELMNQEFGVAAEIARQAGDQYLKECQNVLKEVKQIELTQCVHTGPGNLKNKYVLHVHSPVKFDQHQHLDQLEQITKSVTHCLEKAEQLKATSIAFPFVSAGLSGIPVDLCAQQYFRALQYFKPKEHLRQVKFVDIKRESVSTVCQTMTECMKPDDTNISQTYSELSIMDMGIFIKQGQINAVSCCAIVVSVDKSFNDNDELDDILPFTSQHFKFAFGDEKKRKHHCTEVVKFSADGELTSKFVLFAVTPVWKSDPENYAKNIRITTQNILKITCESQQTDLAMPVLCNSEDAEVLSCCCKAMAESLIEFSRNNRNKIEMIHLLIKQEKAVSAMCHAMAVTLKLMSGDITALPADCIVFYSNEKFEEVRDGKGLFVHVCCENNRQACTLCAKTGVLKLCGHRTIYGDKKVLHVLGQALSMEDLKDAIEMCLEEATRLNCSSVSMPVMISANTELKWRRMNLKKQKVFFNVILAAGMESDLKEATHDIVNLCTTADISGDSTEVRAACGDKENLKCTVRRVKRANVPKEPASLQDIPYPLPDEYRKTSGTENSDF